MSKTYLSWSWVRFHQFTNRLEVDIVKMWIIGENFKPSSLVDRERLSMIAVINTYYHLEKGNKTEDRYKKPNYKEYICHVHVTLIITAQGINSITKSMSVRWLGSSFLLHDLQLSIHFPITLTLAESFSV